MPHARIKRAWKWKEGRVPFRTNSHGPKRGKCSHGCVCRDVHCCCSSLFRKIQNILLFARCQEEVCRIRYVLHRPQTSIRSYAFWGIIHVNVGLEALKDVPLSIHLHDWLQALASALNFRPSVRLVLNKDSYAAEFLAALTSAQPLTTRRVWAVAVKLLDALHEGVANNGLWLRVRHVDLKCLWGS